MTQFHPPGKSASLENEKLTVNNSLWRQEPVLTPPDNSPVNSIFMRLRLHSSPGFAGA